MLIGAQQENLLVLLSFDDTRALIIRGIIGPELWGGHYRLIAARIYDYIDKYKKAPKDHLPDILSDKIEAEGREAELYIETIESISSAREGINAIYVMSQLETFIKRQSLRSVAVEFNRALLKDTEESLDEASALMAKANTATLSVFDPGIRLSDKRSLAFLDMQEQAFPTGVPELDKRGFGPTRKELWLYIADTKGGKTWALMQLGKMAALHRFKVCHVSLEMSRERCAQRYYQSLFAISKRKETFRNTKFKKDKLGRITGYDNVRVQPSLSYDDPNVRKKLERRITRHADRLLDNIIIRDFPMGTLTVNQLKAYLDNLEQSERFVPDLLILDYPDLLRLDKDNYRLSIDEAYKDLRGIASARNMAVAVVSQSHRAGAKAKQVGADNVAEAYSKIAHADTIITRSQTMQEKKLGLARLFVAGGRNDEDRMTIVISQQYGMGTYVVDSSLMLGNYFESIPQNGFAEDDDE
jgi:DnaB-like helicase C terminal domain